MKKENKKKNNLFSTNYFLIGFVTILAILFAFTYFNPVFSSNSFEFNDKVNIGELYSLGRSSDDSECSGSTVGKCPACYSCKKTGVGPYFECVPLDDGETCSDNKGSGICTSGECKKSCNDGIKCGKCKECKRAFVSPGKTAPICVTNYDCLKCDDDPCLPCEECKLGIGGYNCVDKVPLDDSLEDTSNRCDLAGSADRGPGRCTGGRCVPVSSHCKDGFGKSIIICYNGYICVDGEDGGPANCVKKDSFI